MQRFWQAIKRHFHKWPDSAGLLSTQQAYGKWYVLYSNGERSQRFYYRTAKDYAKMFGGEVFHIEDTDNKQ